MFDLHNFQKNIFNLHTDQFDDAALALFDHQATHNPIYAKYCEALGRVPGKVNKVTDIPFMPISFFKEHEIKTGEWHAEKVFESSRTTGAEPSRHALPGLDFYHKVSETIFEAHYGPLSDYHILALLPGYLERDTSSLVYMVQHFMNVSGSPHADFYLDDREKLMEKLEMLTLQEGGGRKILLIGVTFALLDLAEVYQKPLSGVTIMETGGMKGRRREMVRYEVHDILKQAFGVSDIHSEYGMTELLSQAYAPENGRFRTPSWMKLFIRDINDPFHIENRMRSGAVNVVDLANTHSCAFIETQDVGRYHPNGGVEILGRMDNSDVRGCNLLLIR